MLRSVKPDFYIYQSEKSFTKYYHGNTANIQWDWYCLFKDLR